MDGGEVLALRQVMTISREEFLRCLPAAVGHDPYVVAGESIRSGAVCGADSARGWRITVAPLSDLAIDLLRLPRHHVNLFLRGYDPVAARAFLDRFELYFRRGGG